MWSNKKKKLCKGVCNGFVAYDIRNDDDNPKVQGLLKFSYTIEVLLRCHATNITVEIPIVAIILMKWYIDQTIRQVKLTHIYM